MCGGFWLVAGRLPLPRALVATTPFHRGAANPDRLRRRLGLDAPAAQLLGKGLAPAVQVFLARIQAFAVTPFRAHADVHMRIGLVRVQHHHVAVVRQLGLRELARGLLHAHGHRCRPASTA